MKLAFALPAVVLDAEAARGTLLLRDDLVARERREVGQPLGFAGAAPALAVAIANSPRDRQEVVAGIALLGERIGGIEELAIARVDGASERVELPAGVVDDPFDEDVVTAKAHRVGECRTDRHRAALHHDERSGRVCAAELQRNAQPVARPFAESFAFAQNLCDCCVPDRRRQAQVDEAGDRFDAAEDLLELGRTPLRLGDDFRGEFLWRAPRPFRERERDVGGEVAELGTARRLERDGRRRVWILICNDAGYGVGKSAQRVIDLHYPWCSPPGGVSTRA